MSNETQITPLPQSIADDPTLRDYKLFNEARLVAWWERLPSPDDIPANHEWHGSWTLMPKEKLDEYNLRYTKRKFFAKVVGKDNIKEELAAALNELRSRVGKEV